MAVGLPSDQQLSASLAETVQERLLEAMEPALEAAVEQFRIAARKQLAAMAVAAISTGYSVERSGQIVHIRVHLD
jgi:formate dehydrogenase maturation protein FdhE